MTDSTKIKHWDGYVYGSAADPCMYCQSIETVPVSGVMNYYVACTVCGARGPSQEDRKLAIDTWNGNQTPDIYN